MNTRARWIFLGVAAIGLSPASATADSAAAPAVPAIVERAARVYAAAMKGTIGMERHFNTVVDGGPIHHTEVSDSAYLSHDGMFEKIAYSRIVRDGKAFDRSALEKRNAQANADWAAGKVFFKEPYDPRYIGDYRFEATACAACAAGTVAVSFSSKLSDTQHGDGTMWIDDNAHVTKLTYAPKVLPPHASSGTVTETGGPAMPDLWYVTHIAETYGGHVLFVKGSGTFTGTFDHFARFATLAEGLKAIAAGSV